MITERITEEDIKNIFSGANGQADIEMKKNYLQIKIGRIGIEKVIDQLSVDDIVTLIFKIRKVKEASEILEKIVGTGKRVTTKKSIDVIFTDDTGTLSCYIQKKYLKELFLITGVECFLDALSKEKINDLIILTWDYIESKNILRTMFKETDKYKNNKAKKEKIDNAILEWKAMELGELKWPFAAINFDDVVHRLNRREDISDKEKDDILCEDVIKFRRIKDISSLKNDYIEYLIFEKNENIVPTFGNKGGVDFYIDGKPFDQKVSKSVGGDFIKQYGDEYRRIAIENPSLLAKSLYEHQDANRFGAEPRFLVVYLDVDMTSNEIEKKLENVDFSKPMQIEFEYPSSDKVMKRYSTSCYLILLHR